MTREEFLKQLDEILELPPGTLRGPESLDGLGRWTSMAMIEFIALADKNGGVKLSPRQFVGCKSVDDLLNLVKLE